MTKAKDATTGEVVAKDVVIKEPQVIEKIVEKVVYVDRPVETIKETPKEEYPNTDFLRNEIVTIQYIKKVDAFIKDPKHVGYGGLFVGSSIAIPAPVLNNQLMKNILTDKEKKGLEFLLGLDLSVYKDFWKKEYNKGGLFPIYLGKEDTRLDLSDPMQYIKYKVLCASPLVANSLDEVRNSAAFRFVMVKEGEEIRKQKDAVGVKIMAMESYVKYKNNKSVLRYILRNLGKYTNAQQKMDFIQVEAAKLTESQPDLFVSVATDDNLVSKVLIEECIEYSVINKIESKLYTRDNQPISGGETPTLEVSSKYLSSPLGQELRLVLEAKLKIAKD